MHHFTRFISLLVLVGVHGARTRSLQSIAWCANDDSYHLPLKPDHDCRWVKSNEAFRQKYCQSEIVKSKCSISCGECCEDDSNFTFTINEVGVNAPVSSPSKGNPAGPSKGNPARPSKGRNLAAGPSKGTQTGPSKGYPTTNSSPANDRHHCKWLNQNDSNAEKYCETDTFGGRKVQDGKNEPHHHYIF